MKKVYVVAVLLLLLVAAVEAVPAKSPAVARSVYSRMDANGDGVITVTEHAAFWQGRFKEIDVNNDGKISAEEFNVATMKFFGDMDTDKNGALVAKEYIAFWCGPKAVFLEKIKPAPQKSIDANQNGIISDDECVVFWVVNFYDMDQNKDGKITLDEFMAAMAKRFKQIDKNGDGFISLQEHSYFQTGKAASAK